MLKLVKISVLAAVLLSALLLPAGSSASNNPGMDMTVSIFFTTDPVTGVTPASAVFHGKFCQVITFTSGSMPTSPPDEEWPFIFRYGIPGANTSIVNAEVDSITENQVETGQSVSLTICYFFKSTVTGLRPCSNYRVRMDLNPNFLPDLEGVPVTWAQDVGFFTPGCQTNTYGAGSLSSFSTTATSLQPVPLSNIVVQSAALQGPARVSPGQKVNVSATVANTGASAGTSRIALYVNGREVESRGVNLSGGNTAPVDFSFSRSEPGSYSVNVGGVSAGSCTVEQTADSNAILYTSIALIAAALIGGLACFTRRRPGG